jgi:hypothetical protein
MGKKPKPSLAGQVAGTVQRAFDPYSRGSNQCYPFGERPAGAKFTSNSDDLYKSLTGFRSTRSASNQGHPLLHIAVLPIVLLYFLVFLPLVMCFRDSLLGGVYILAGLASYYQLEGKGRIVFMSVLGGFFYWWCISRALWGPNNDILNTLEALNSRGFIKLPKRFSVKRGNPFTGLVTRTIYINTTKLSVGFNCCERWNLDMDDVSLKGDNFSSDSLECRFWFPSLQVAILFQKDDTVSADILEDEHGMISIKCGDNVLTDYNSYHIFQRIHGYFTFLSFNPDNMTCSETIGSEMGIPCAYAISLREVFDHFAESSGIFQMKFDKEILVK